MLIINFRVKNICHSFHIRNDLKNSSCHLQVNKKHALLKSNLSKTPIKIHKKKHLHSTFSTEMTTSYELQNKICHWLSVSISGFAIFANIWEIYLLHKSSKRPFSILLISLASSDAISSLAVIFIIVITYVLYGGKFHNLEQAKATQSTSYCLFFGVVVVVNLAVINSWLHITLIAFERWAAVFYPLRQKHFITKSLSKIAVTIVWIASGVISGGLLGDYFTTKSAAIAEKVIAAFIIGSNILVIVTYASIIKKIRKVSHTWKKRNSDQPCTCSSVDVRHEKSVVVSCLLITALFTTLTFPILYSLVNGNPSYNAIATVLVAMDKLVNPGIYFFKTYGSCGG